MSVYKNLEAMTDVALHNAKEHGCNYNVIIHNHVDGDFHPERSTYECVTDSYFEKERPNVRLVYTTDDLMKNKLQDEVNKPEYIDPFAPDPMWITNPYTDSYLDYQDYIHDMPQRRPAQFVREESKIGNNDVCPKCDSGKKYKKCCKR